MQKEFFGLHISEETTSSRKALEGLYFDEREDKEIIMDKDKGGFNHNRVGRTWISFVK